MSAKPLIYVSFFLRYWRYNRAATSWGVRNMSRLSDREYHEARARQELQLADEASDPWIAKTHRELAALHRRRMLEIVHIGEPQLAPSPLVGTRQPRPDLS